MFLRVPVEAFRPVAWKSLFAVEDNDFRANIWSVEDSRFEHVRQARRSLECIHTEHIVDPALGFDV